MLNMIIYLYSISLKGYQDTKQQVKNRRSIFYLYSISLKDNPPIERGRTQYE